MTLAPFRRLLLCLALASGSVACGKKDVPAETPDDKPTDEGGEPSGEADAASESAEDVAAKDNDVAEPGKRKNPRDRVTGRRPPPRGRDKIDADAVDGEPAGTDPKGDLVGGEAVPDGAEPKLPVDGKTADGKPLDGTPLDGKVADIKLPGPSVDPTLPSDAKAEPPPGIHKPLPDTVAHTNPPLDALRMMPLQAVVDATQAKGLVDAGSLPGIAIGSGYVSIIYKRPTADLFGVALQAWQDPARREADDRFRRMRLQYPNAEDVQVLQPAKAFFAHFSGIQMLTFVDSVKRIVATVSCAEDLCTHDQLTKLAKSVREKL